MKFHIRLLVNMICVCLFLVSLVHILSIVAEPADDVVFTNQSMSINHADQILLHDDGQLYIGDSAKGVIQIFDPDGNFLYGIHLQTGGGAFWMGLSEEELHVYVVRRDVEYTIQNKSVSSRRDAVYYDSPTAFHQQFEYNPDVNVKFSLTDNVVYQNLAEGTEKIIKLEVPLWPLPMGVYFAGILLSVVGLFAVNGLFGKLYNPKHVDDNDVVRFFRKRGNKLK